jgi:hypothetical protein
MSDETALLEKIQTAVKAANEAKAESDSRAKVVGTLLIELKRQCRGTKEFEASLGKIEGLRSLSWAYTCMNMASGRLNYNDHKKQQHERQAKSRAKKKLSKPNPTLPEDFRGVTEKSPDTKSEQTALIDVDASADTMRAKFATDEAAETTTVTALDGDILEPDHHSGTMLAAFQEACKRCLPHLTEPDLKKAHIFFMEKKWQPRTRNREAA